ncbi:hypothetical protein COLO4_37058 [Corchorus olitorius]|uniref:Uncharacterized protein n=1 Tax=Corchorus olitorius TaxID=93759 RepID=A0A1R3G3H7_9ROSI|nr:hypothetical protein COLO4_37058 [Corchorus olitorius]
MCSVSTPCKQIPLYTWVRKNLRMHVGDIDAAGVPCGFGRAIGNKVSTLTS